MDSNDLTAQNLAVRLRRTFLSTVYLLLIFELWGCYIVVDFPTKRKRENSWTNV